MLKWLQNVQGVNKNRGTINK